MNKLIKNLGKTLLSLFVLSQLAPSVFLDSVIVKATEKEIIISGRNAPMTLSSSKADLYIFDNAIINGTLAQPNAVTIETGNAVRIEFRGKNEIHGFDAQLRSGTPGSVEMETQAFDRSGAGILVQEKNTKLIITGDKDAVLNITGGNGGNGSNGGGTGGATGHKDHRGGARGYGGAGGSAAIGAQGGVRIRDVALNKIDDLSAAGGNCGEIVINGEMKLIGHGGYGGAGGGGGGAGGGYDDRIFIYEELHSNGGGGGGGGGGYPAPFIGGGGAAGGDGAKGGTGDFKADARPGHTMAPGASGGGGGYGWGGGGGGNAASTIIMTYMDKFKEFDAGNWYREILNSGGDGYVTSVNFAENVPHQFGNPGKITVAEAFGYIGSGNGFVDDVSCGFDSRVIGSGVAYGAPGVDVSKAVYQYVKTNDPYEAKRIASLSSYGGTKERAGINTHGMYEYGFTTPKAVINKFHVSQFYGWGSLIKASDKHDNFTNFDSFASRDTEYQPDSSVYGMKGEITHPLKVSESITINSDNKGFDGYYGNGEGSNVIVKNKFGVLKDIDLSDPDLKVEMTPSSHKYRDGKELDVNNLTFKLTTKNGLELPRESYIAETVGDAITPDHLVSEGNKLKIRFKRNDAYKDLNIVNVGFKNYTITRGNRPVEILSVDGINSAPINDTLKFSISESLNGDAASDKGRTISWKVTMKDNPDFSCTENVTNEGKNLELSNLQGVGKFNVDVTVSQSDYYEESVAKTFVAEVSKGDVRNLSPSVDTWLNVVTYNAEAQIQNPIILAYNPTTGLTDMAVNHVDYELSWLNNVNAGRAYMVITGMGIYEGTKMVPFQIEPKSIVESITSSSNVVFDQLKGSFGSYYLDNINYTGTGQKASVGVGSFPKESNPAESVILVDGVDYNIAYDNLVNAGPVNIEIVGMGNYTGSVKATYSITPFDLSTIAEKDIKLYPPKDVIYNGKEQKLVDNEPRIQIVVNDDDPDNIVKYDLVLGTDYDLDDFRDNINVGEAGVSVFGKNNFEKKLAKDVLFNIIPKDLVVVPDNLSKITGKPDIPLTYTFSGLETGDTVTIKAGTKLERIAGEKNGDYPILLGTLALDEGDIKNKNYSLKLDSIRKNFSIIAYTTDKNATVTETYKNPVSGWSQGNEKIMAPAGFRMSFTNTPTTDIDGNEIPIVWKDEISPTDTGMYPGDGDFVKTPLTYYLKNVDPVSPDFGNVTTEKLLKYQQDGAAPIGQINMNDEKIYTDYKSDVKFDTYFKTDINLNIFGKDVTSGMQTTRYYLADKNMSQVELGALPDDAWTALVKDAATDNFNEVLSSEMKKIMYYEIKDFAGYTTYVNTRGFYLDKIKPEIVIKYDREGKWTADKNITVDLEIKENGSGIKDRYLDYRSVDIDDPTIEGNPVLLYVDADGKTSIPLGEIDDGKLKFLVNATDNAGNTISEDIIIMKDTTKPILELLADTASYAQSKDIDINALVGGSGVEQVFMQRQGNGIPYDDAKWVDITDKYTVSPKINVTENGTYYFKYRNGAQVTSNVADITFTTIDALSPTLVVSATSNNVPILSNVWSGSSVKLVFTNDAKNLGATSYYYRTKSQGESGFGAWKKALKNYAGSGQIEIGDSGEIQVELKAVAANGLEDIKPFIVKIDKRAPFAKISKNSNEWSELLQELTFNLFYKNVENIEISGVDIMSGLESIEYCLVKGDIAEEVQDKASIEGFVSENGGWTKGTIVGDKIAVAINPNNKYVIYGKVSDKVGNVQYVSSDGIIVDDEAPTLIVDKSGFVDFGAEGKWIVDPNHEPVIEVSDTLSGPDYVEVTIDGKVVREDVRSGNALMKLSKDGKYSVDVAAFDRSGNRANETVMIQRDTAPVQMLLEGDTVNVGVKKHVSITPSFGASGLGSLEVKFVPEGQSADSISWTNMKDNYDVGVDLLENGTVYARMSNNLGYKAEHKLVFKNIRYIDPVVEVDLVNENNEIVTGGVSGWMEAVRVRFYNDPKEVSDFEYYYQIDAGSWEQVDPATVVDGYAYIQAMNGSHEYNVKTVNVAPDRPSEESAVASVTAKVDADKPVGKITLEDGDLTTADKEWADTKHADAYKVNQGYIDDVSIQLASVKDIAGGSGLRSVEIAVLRSVKDLPLKDYPKNDTEMRTMLAAQWKPLTDAQFDMIKNGMPVNILSDDPGYEYMVFAKIKDEAGNTSYITSGGFSVRKSSIKPTIDSTYNGKWIVKDETVPITIHDVLSNNFTGEIIKTKDSAPVSTPFTLVNENQVFLNTADFVDGAHLIAVTAMNNALVKADEFNFSLNIDRIKPSIKVVRNAIEDTDKFIFLEVVPTVGPSLISKVEVIMPDGTVEDLTGNYAQGYKVKQNGLYQFSVTNNAGVKSELTTYKVDELAGNPIVLVEGFLKDSGTEYTSGDWSDEEVDLRISPKEILTGTTAYYYREKGKSEWKQIFEAEGEYWLNVKDNGEYVYEFKIQAENGLESEIVEYAVNIFKDDLTLDYELSKTELTRGGVELKIIPTNTGDDVLYSFDNGTTFGNESIETFYSNQYVDVVIKGKAGNTGKRQVKISNIDNLAPLMGLQGSEIEEEVKVKIMMAVNDSPKTLDFEASGVGNVFLTRNNPIKNGEIRSIMETGDEAFVSDVSGSYTINTEVYTDTDENSGDNVWIVAADNVGNASVKSLRVEPNKKVVEEPVEPGKPGDGSGNNTATNEPGKIINEITYNRKIAYAEQTIDNTSIEKIDKALKEFRELQKKKNELNNKQVNKITSRISELNQKKTWWILVYIACGLFAVSGLSYAYFRYRSKKRAEEELDSFV